MIRLIMIMQLAFFFAAGAIIMQHQITCARSEGVASILVTMPMQSLSEVVI